MNVKVAIAIVLLAAAVGIGITSVKKTMTPYVGFAEAKANNGLVQVFGTLADKNYVLKLNEQYMRFNLKDARGDVMPVEYRGVIPGNFDQAVSIVAIGQYRADHFEATQLLVKCPSKYQALSEKSGKVS